MSEELIDFRGKITKETNAVLESINRVKGLDRSEIAREVLHKWACEQIEVSKELNRQLNTPAMRGNDRDHQTASQGTSGNRRENGAKAMNTS